MTGAFHLETVREPDALGVRCHGQLVAGETSLFHDEVRPLIGAGKRIVLDLTDVTKMDSMGLGAVVRLYVSARSAGCEFELYNIGPRIRQLLGIANLLSFFTIVGENNIRVP